MRIAYTFMSNNNNRPSAARGMTMTTILSMNRRNFLRATATGVAASAMPGLISSPVLAQTALTVGFIYVGPKDDYGYNQAHAEGAAVIKAMPGVTLVEEENVPETVDVQKSMESMINLDGASLVLPTSFGYFDPHMLAMAAKYPDTQFRHCGGLWQEGKHPANTGSYFGYIHQGQYLNGIAAGYATKSKKIGFVAAKPIPQVLQNINAFLLGARSVDPAVTCQVIFTGEWSLAVKEAEATNALVDQGVDVVTCHVDSPKVVVETAAGRGAFVCGYHANQSPLAPEKYLTGAEWAWGNIYTDFVTKVQAGEKPGNFVRGGLKDGFVKMSPLGPGVSQEARTKFDATLAEAMAGKLSVFKGPLNDNKGNAVIAVDKAYAEDAIDLESMAYLVEGVLGSTS